MKKYLFLLTGCFLICCYACKKNNKDTSVSIVGKWHPVKLTGQIYSNGIQSLNYTDTSSTNDFIQFNNDGTGFANLNGTNIPVIIGDFKYTYSENTLKYTAYGYNISATFPPNTIFTIVKITQTSLEMRSDIIDTLSNGSMDRRIEDGIYRRN